MDSVAECAVVASVAALAADIWGAVLAVAACRLAVVVLADSVLDTSVVALKASKGCALMEELRRVG